MLSYIVKRSEKMDKNKIYIGDNLKIMNSKNFEQYYNKIDFIYIDPPYNTLNNSFAFSDKNETWKEDLCKRLEISKKLLSDSGSIFISIDDNELQSLIEICCRIFGKQNYIGNFITKQAVRSNAKHINTIHEYILVFAKDKRKLPKFYIKRLDNPCESNRINSIIKKVKKDYLVSSEKGQLTLKESIDKYILETGKSWILNYSHINENGEIFFAKDLSTPGTPKEMVIDEIGINLKPLKTRSWSSKNKFIELYKSNRLYFKNGRPYEIEYLHEATDSICSILDFYSRQGTNDLKKLGLDGIFDTPKPVEMIKYLIRLSQHKDSIILDFYAGSGTTAQAVYEINNSDNKNHKYILIQLDEKINPKSKSYEFMKKQGYENSKVSDLMIYRIETFLKLNKISGNYEVEDGFHE